MTDPHDPDPLFAGRFRLGDLLGVGGAAAVCQAVDLRADDDADEPGTGATGGVPDAAGATGDASGTAGYVGADDEGTSGGRGPLTVALKVPHPHLGADPRLREAFLREARSAAGAVHPNVARVHAAGLDHTGVTPTAWLAMTLTPGGSLAPARMRTTARRLRAATTAPGWPG